MIKTIEKFGASWCNPCKKVEQSLESVLKIHPEIELTVYDADEDEEKFVENHVTTIPQLFFYDENGAQVNHLIGAYSASELNALIDECNTEVINTTFSAKPVIK